ncbi:zinc finger protein with KRAB and SCAN domains 1-like isoform X4 [Sphaerodactylus townsendi]|uniref:zinc finger protein with KRAB and SCAN domains 1-like isoform X4 n=1 Tax=Sphaerodactylus townsendi TaxID=933632 RepID=UPI00202766C2|nr:zinc finger protein with KRAB and SCAN domains 1-like isoform X4 [Sphaerodactylus townsendi]XP_048344988.1 zinc finger protein with KRAB and SCAN domains 1-like isoform X4 [Sphaerodactylus townsendi]
MKGQSSALPKEGPEGARNPVSVTQSEFTGERSSWKATQESRWDPSKGMQQHWETQWQEFLKTLQSPHSAWGGPQLAETPLWDDAKAFLTSFEQVAQACQWPREEWVARLLPALSGEAQQAFGILEARDREDYGKVKAAILRGEANRMEALRQHFRQFRSREVEDPRRLYSQLQELCHQWLRPERHSKEQILELLILEQFLAILPPELQSWIRAGGPENCTQAAALVDDFLLTQQKAETWKWQEPLQEMIRGTLEVEESASDFDQRPVVKVTKGNNSREAGLLGSQMTCPNDSDISLPPKEQDATKAKLAEMPATLKETGVPLHMVEPALPKPSQRTMFWQVMQEDEGNADSLEGLLVPKSGLEKGDEMFAQFPGESERLPGQDPGLEKRSRIKMEGSRKGEAGPEETQGMTAEISQWNFPAATEIHVPRCGEKRSQIKIEHSQQEEARPEKTPRTVSEGTQWSMPGPSKIHRQKDEYVEEHRKKTVEGRNECSEATDASEPSVSETAALCVLAKNPFVAKCGRSDHHESDFLVKHPAEDYFEHPTLEENLEQKSDLDKYQTLLLGERCYECPECGKIFHMRSKFMRHRSGHMGEKYYKCSECRRSFASKGALTKHLRLHTGEKLHRCSECGNCFIERAHLIRHQTIHTGEKPHECSDCGRTFPLRANLIRHQSSHMGKKPLLLP